MQMTTTPDFRALCAELFDQLSAYDGCNDGEEVSQHWNYTNCNELLYSARTALKATPPPEPPTDQQIKEWIDAKLGADKRDPEAFGWGWRCFKGEAFAVTIRAALERWGR